MTKSYPNFHRSGGTELCQILENRRSVGNAPRICFIF